MINRPIIYKGLAQHLQNNFSLPNNVAWENVTFSSKGLDMWVKEYFMPVDTEQITLGEAGSIRDYGMYQLTVKTKTGIGTTQSQNYIQELSTLYKQGTAIVVDGYTIHIEATTPATGIVYEGWWSVPLTIDWSCNMTLN